MRILVSVATRHGSTGQIADRIAAELRLSLPGCQVDLLPAAAVDDVTQYEAVVLGSAVYFGRWLAEARRAASRIARQPARLVWLFSSGPVEDLAKPEPLARGLADLVAATQAREHRIFAGRLDRNRLRFTERTVLRARGMAGRDLRDWDAITAWAAQIAVLLSRPGTTPELVSPRA
jgi:menaquinone-dependent protoporphyrinogen oxidase